MHPKLRGKKPAASHKQKRGTQSVAASTASEEPIKDCIWVRSDSSSPIPEIMPPSRSTKGRSAQTPIVIGDVDEDNQIKSPPSPKRKQSVDIQDDFPRLKRVKYGLAAPEARMFKRNSTPLQRVNQLAGFPTPDESPYRATSLETEKLKNENRALRQQLEQAPAQLELLKQAKQSDDSAKNLLLAKIRELEQKNAQAEAAKSALQQDLTHAKESMNQLRNTNHELVTTRDASKAAEAEARAAQEQSKAAEEKASTQYRKIASALYESSMSLQCRELDIEKLKEEKAEAITDRIRSLNRKLVRESDQKLESISFLKGEITDKDEIIHRMDTKIRDQATSIAEMNVLIRERDADAARNFNLLRASENEAAKQRERIDLLVRAYGISKSAISYLQHSLQERDSRGHEYNQLVVNREQDAAERQRPLSDSLPAVLDGKVKLEEVYKEGLQVLDDINDWLLLAADQHRENPDQGRCSCGELKQIAVECRDSMAQLGHDLVNIGNNFYEIFPEAKREEEED